MESKKILKNVYEDLCYLKERWNDSIEPKEIRVTGSILRRLIVESHLKIAWNKIYEKKYNPKFEIVDVDSIAGNFTSDEIEFILSGGAEYKGIYAENIMLIKGTRRILKEYKIEVPLNKFPDSTSIQIKHIKINNRELINYVCNKLGGVHYDDRRRNKDIEKKFIYLDHLLDEKKWVNIDMLGLDPIRFQFLSIGQIINRSKDIESFLRKLKNNI